MIRWTMLTLIFAVAIVGFAGVSQARDFGMGGKVITARHGGGGGGGRGHRGGGGGRRGGGGHRGGWGR